MYSTVKAVWKDDHLEPLEKIKTGENISYLVTVIDNSEQPIKGEYGDWFEAEVKHGLSEADKSDAKWYATEEVEKELEYQIKKASE
jgi:hypothetical protein